MAKKQEKSAVYFLCHYCRIYGIVFLQQWNGTAQMMYWICAGLGFGTGFWAIFVTMGAEQFGTNLRATAATTIPNMVRGAVGHCSLHLYLMG